MESPPSNNIMSYQRKRVSLACDFCRSRKRKCDGGRPCSTCKDSEADCIYKELPMERRESPGGASEGVSERLARIELLLEEQSQRLTDMSRGGTSSLHSAGGFVSQDMNMQQGLATFTRWQGEDRDEQNPEQAQFLIPLVHSTSANSLLALPQTRFLVGDYPSTYFAEIEERLPLPPQLDLLRATSLSWPPPNPAILDALTEDYFELVHPNNPFICRKRFETWKAEYYAQGPTETIQTAICCCVWALGALVHKCRTFTSIEEQNERDEMALKLFQPALRFIISQSTWEFHPTLELCQGLLLAATYFAHHGRVLHNSKMALFASRHFLHIIEDLKRSGVTEEYDVDVIRVFWACFMMECDRSAELQVVRSGVEPMADKMLLPRSMDPSESDDMILFVAETAIRRLLNRIHSSLYASDSDVSMAHEGAAGPSNINYNKLLALGSELNRQLEEWYSSIPGKLRPPIGTEPINSDRGKILRIRYYAARHIIHRPFILCVALQQMRMSASPSPGGRPSSSLSNTLPYYPIPEVVIEKCQICISSCETYLYNVVAMLDRRSPYIWSFSQSCMACLLVLLIADSCPQLRPFVPDIAPLQAMVLTALRRWGTPGSSFEAEIRIIESLRVRDHY